MADEGSQGPSEENPRKCWIIGVLESHPRFLKYNIARVFRLVFIKHSGPEWQAFPGDEAGQNGSESTYTNG